MFEQLSPTRPDGKPGKEVNVLDEQFKCSRFGGNLGRTDKLLFSLVNTLRLDGNPDKEFNLFDEQFKCSRFGGNLGRCEKVLFSHVNTLRLDGHDIPPSTYKSFELQLSSFKVEG